MILEYGDLCVAILLILCNGLRVIKTKTALHCAEASGNQSIIGYLEGKNKVIACTKVSSLQVRLHFIKPL